MKNSASAFISHASKDNPFVAHLRQSLQTHGARIWADGRELLPGDVLEPQIQQAITDHEVFFLVVSGHTFQSKWVKKELDFAKSLQKRIVVLLLDEQTVGALAWMFDEEPLAVSVSTAPGGLPNALPELLAALGLRLPDEPDPGLQSPEPPVSELILALERPRLYTEGGVRRGSARARLEFLPADGSPRVESESFEFISPLGPDVADRIRWYVEEFPRYPFLEKLVARAKEVSGQLPGWGKALFEAVTAEESARALLLEWKGDKQHERRFSVKLNASTPPAGADEAQQAQFFEAAGLLLSTPWEILHHGEGFLFQGQRPVRVRRMQPNRKKKDPLPLQNLLRILLVAPRPEDDLAGLIDHRAATRALLTAVEALGDMAELHILDTPTFPAMSQKIREAAAQGRPFTVVHFDGHGVFDQNKGLGALCFESAEADEQAKIEGRATAIVDAAELAAELNELRVPLFFLDACQSAKTDHDPTASVAAKLLENGVASVAAMSHSVLVSAAEKFAVAFYQKLAEGALIGSAMLAGQQALHTDPVRGALPGGEKLRLQDWFVPVLFQEDKDPQLVRRIPGRRARQLAADARAAYAGYTPEGPHGGHRFVGRDRDLLALERLLRRPERYAVLQGQGGAGKTTLAAELARWLLRTGRFERLAFVSFDPQDRREQAKAGDVRTAIDVLGRQLVASDFSVATFPSEAEALLHLDRSLGDFRTLIVLDNMESSLPPAPSPEERGDATTTSPVGPGFEPFAALFSRLKKSGATLLFTSRERLPAPFDAGKCHRRIGPLPPPDALRLIAEVMEQEGIEVPSLNTEDLDKQFGALARTANYHARALTLLAKTLAERGDRLPELNADLSLLMAELEQKYPGDRENSLFASLELSLRRLPPAVRELVDALAVYHGGADVATWAMVAEQEQEVVANAGMALVQVGLAEVALDRYPNYFKTDPALPAYLRSRTPPERLEAKRQRWLEGMVALSDFLYEQKFKDAQLAYDLCRLTEANLLALLTDLEKHAAPEQIVNAAGRIENLFSQLGRPQVVQFAQTIRQKAAAGMSAWSHAQFTHKSATIDRYLEQGDLNAAFQLAQEVLRQGEQAGETAYPEARYDGAVAHFSMGKVLKTAGRSEQALPFLQEAERRFGVLADEGNADAARMASVCLTEIGDCFSDLGQYDEAARKYEACIQMSEKQNDPRQIAVGKGQLATVRMYQKNYPEALRLYGEAKTIFEEYREPGSVATGWHQIGMVHQGAQNYPAAEKAYLESLAIEIREKNKSGEASSLTQLGNLYGALERLEDALRVYERAADLYVELEDLRYEGVVRNNLANTLIKLHRPADARTQLLRAIECKSHFGHVAEPWRTWAILCDLETAEGNLPAAAAARQQAMQAYAAYRLAGGESQSNQFRLISGAEQALQAEQQAQMVEYLQSTLKPDNPHHYVALIRQLTALLRGSRDLAVVDDPELDYMNAVELRLVFFGGGG